MGKQQILKRIRRLGEVPSSQKPLVLLHASGSDVSPNRISNQKNKTKGIDTYKKTFYDFGLADPKGRVGAQIYQPKRNSREN